MRTSFGLLFCGAVLFSGCKLAPITEWNAVQAQNQALAEQNRRNWPKSRTSAGTAGPSKTASSATKNSSP